MFNEHLILRADARNGLEHIDKAYEEFKWYLDLIGDDFYIECAPSTKWDQIAVNQKLRAIANAYHIPMVVGTDAHYLTEQDREIHKAYLNSKEGEREVDDFYEFARLMDFDEAEEILAESFEGRKDIAEQIIQNTILIQEKIEDYSLERKQIIPKVKVPFYESYQIYQMLPEDISWEFGLKWPTLDRIMTAGNDQERYWLAECEASMLEKGFIDKPEYWDRLEIEADVINYIGEKLDDCLFAYFNTFKHYIDLFWECGSTVGPGRGSATGFLSNYLLGITQLDPIRWGLPYWRFLNKERAELPDIDIDLAPSKRPAIFKAIREERGELGLVQVATFGTEGTKSAVLTACRGYRSEDYPDGIDVDVAQYMSSLIPQERGFLWSISDVVNGNPDKDRKPVTTFIREVSQYPGLLNIIQSIEGLVNKLWEEYELTPNNVENYTKPDNIQETTKKVNSLRNKIKDLGSINIDAIEEYKQTSQRYDFMCEQRLDLENSIAKLRIKEAEETNADLLVSACPFCKLNLSQNSDDLEILDLSEFVLEHLASTDDNELINISDSKEGEIQ